MSAHLFIDGKSVDVVGDGMGPNSAAGEWPRDARFPDCFGSFGYVTTHGDAIPDALVGDVAECLSGMYAGQADPDEESQT